MKYYGVIYKILNKVNGKVYIGQTIRTFKDRYRCKGTGIERVYGYHKKRKEKKYDYNEHLLNSIEKYGFESFEVIEEFDIANDKEELDKKEIYWIAYFDSFHNGYNQTEGGGGTSGFIPPIERKVINLTENKIFDSVTKAAEEYEVSRAGIIHCCKGYRVRNGKKCNVCYWGKLSDGTPLVWKYYDEYLREQL